MSPEDQKLVALARAAKARIQAEQGAAVRDETGRSYAGATVALPSLQLSALDVAVAQAVAAGARGLEAAVVVSGHAPALSAVAELAGPGVPVWHCDARGDVLEELTT
ncbi:MAG: cytidine deaminase [Actinobacteria bacterium]|nr:MAG: cytidine deaminase [Actinomycetota bacterium]